MTPEHSIMSDSIREIDTMDAESDVNSMFSMSTTNGSAVNNNYKVNSHNIKIDHSPSARATIHQHSTRRSTPTNASTKMRKRLVSTSLIKSPVIDGAFIDYHTHNLNDGQDPFDLKYKLYAVVVSRSFFSSFFFRKIFIEFLFVSVAFRHVKRGSLHFVCLESEQFVVLLQR